MNPSNAVHRPNQHNYNLQTQVFIQIKAYNSAESWVINIKLKLALLCLVLAKNK